MTRLQLLSVALLACAVTAGCSDAAGQSPTVAVGDVERGRVLASRYGCSACHTIPGVTGANATVGPPLNRMGMRVYAGGRVNTPRNLIEFISDPQSVDPRSPMPNVGVTPEDARDLAAFLYSLQ